MSQSPAASKSPLRSTHENREKKKVLINESADRLSSPNRNKSPVPVANLGKGIGKEEDMIFSIKMSKEEYNQYKKTRDNIKDTEVTSKPVNKYGTYSTSNKRSITPTKRR